MSQEYDKIFKENFEQLLPAIIRKVLMLNLREMVTVQTDIHVTLERKPDFVIQAVSAETEETFLLHIEFQSNDDTEMHLRMLEYRGFLRRKFQMPVKQFVLYLGQEPSHMITSVEEEGLSFRYQLVQLIEYDHRRFLASSQPEEVILSILADFQGSTSQSIIQAILLRLKELAVEGIRIDKHIPQLEILSKLRKLQLDVANTILTMPITYNLEEDIRFQQGKEKGQEIGQQIGEQIGQQIGEQKGEKRGRRKGIQHTLRAIQLLSSNKFKSGKMTPEEVAKQSQLDLPTVMTILKSLQFNSDQE